LITFRKLNKKDNNFINKLISNEGVNYEEFSKIGWSINQINNQFNKNVNMSFGLFYDNSLISFIIGDLFIIEKKSEFSFVGRHLEECHMGNSIL